MIFAHHVLHFGLLWYIENHTRKCILKCWSFTCLTYRILLRLWLIVRSAYWLRLEARSLFLLCVTVPSVHVCMYVMWMKTYIVAIDVAYTHTVSEDVCSGLSVYMYMIRTRTEPDPTNSHSRARLLFYHCNTKTHTHKTKRVGITYAKRMRTVHTYTRFNLVFSLTPSLFPLHALVRSHFTSQSNNIDLTIPSHFEMSSVFYVRSMRNVLKLFKFRFRWREEEKQKKKKRLCVFVCIDRYCGRNLYFISFSLAHLESFPK